MTEMHIWTKQTHRESTLAVARRSRGIREGWTGSLGLADGSYYI